MPVYVYECDTCGTRFERRQSMSDEPLTDCPECLGHVHRCVQPVGIAFKGSGFYVTDNKSSSSARTSEKESSKASKEKSTEKGSETSSSTT